MANSKTNRKRKTHSCSDSEDSNTSKRMKGTSNNSFSRIVRYKPLDTLEKQLQSFVDERISLQVELQKTLRNLINIDKDVMGLKEKMEKELTNQLCDDKKEGVNGDIRKLMKQRNLLEESSKVNQNKILLKKKQLSSCKKRSEIVESDDSSCDSDEDNVCFCGH